MKILISNDDGFRARGVNVLADALSALADITVVAPDRNRSAASSSLTIDMPLRVSKISADPYFIYSTSGSPADCVHLGSYRLMENMPDMVVSGINHGANLGDDVLYSGTVAAAMEGRHLGMSAIAVSLVMQQQKNFITAAHFASEMVKNLASFPLEINKILNINVPDLPLDEIKGLKITRLGSRHRQDTIIDTKDPKGRRIYWLGPPTDGEDVGEGTDFHAVSEGYVSVTPISVDFTDHKAMETLHLWLDKVGMD
ncbi:MAG TPA: 5'/3'-nucleotidase SurE [Aeromonadales bacterium]|nr:5'/3'-nucleotidase SurE [Aeromonadales bacterium]